MNKTLIIGCGFLGSNILTHLKTKESFVIGTKFQSKIDGFRQLDITNIDSVNECITEENPDLVINCAANTNLDDLEKNQESANLVNGYGVENIAKACKQNFSRLIHISTDAVFDGKKGLYKEDDKPNPINMYGRSKLLGESLVEKNCNNFLIVRTNMFGYNKKGNFLFNWVLKSLKEKKQIVGFDDIVFNPLEISFLSSLIVELGNLKFSGIVHLGSDEIISKFDFCCQIANIFDLDKKLIKKGSIDDAEFFATRPKNTSLDNFKAKKLLKTTFPSLKEEIAKVKQQIS